MEKVKLCELADIYLGVTHTPEYVFDGVPFLSVKDISGGKICFDDCKYISQEEYDSLSEGAKPKVGDMLFCRVGTLGKPIIIPEGTPLFGSFVSLGYLRNKNADRCDLNYLRYWMYSNSFWKQVNSNVKGASQVNLNTGWLSKFDIDLPEMQEQKYRISVLDKCKVIIEQREEELKVLDDLIKARFVEMFGNPDLNEKEWNIYKMEQLCEVGSSKRIYQNEQSMTGIPFLRISDLVNRMDTGSKECDLYIPEEKYEELKEQELVPLKGDILLTARGTLGRCYIVQEDDEFYFQDGMITWLSNFDEKITALFISYLFSMTGFRKQIDALQAGSTVAYLSISMTKKLDIMVPPLELQIQFADFVNQVDKSKVAVQKALDETQLLFDSLMQEYFG